METQYIIFLDSDDLFASENCILHLVKQTLIAKSDITLGKVAVINESNNIIQHAQENQILKKRITCNSKEYLSQIQHFYFAFSWGGLICLNLIKKYQIYFPESIINEDVYFGFECFLNAQTISYTNNTIYLYRQRAGSISHAQSFHQHKLPLLAKSYLYNANYLLQLLKKYPNESFTHLIDRCLRYNASPAITFCILSNTSKKSDLKILLPYANSKAKLCFYFPCIFKILRSAKLKLKSIQSYISSKITQ